MAVGTEPLNCYIEYGFRSSYAGPFACRKGDMQLALLKGDLGRIRAFVDRMLNEPADGAVKYKPVSSRVMMLYGYNLVSSQTMADHGAVDETLVTFWIPLWADHSGGDGFKVDTLCTTVPFILVDNPLSHITGREIYGFAKALGQFEQDGERMSVKAFGGPSDPAAHAEWLPFLKIGPVCGEEGKDVPIDGATALQELAAELVEDAGAELDLPDLLEALMKMAKEGSPMVFLKQYRDAAEQDHACYQAIVESTAKVLCSTLHKPLRRWHVDIKEIDSHPIGKELGIESQTTRWSVKMTDFDFDVLPGMIVAP